MILHLPLGLHVRKLGVNLIQDFAVCLQRRDAPRRCEGLGFDLYLLAPHYVALLKQVSRRPEGRRSFLQGHGSKHEAWQSSPAHCQCTSGKPLWLWWPDDDDDVCSSIESTTEDDHSCTSCPASLATWTAGACWLLSRFLISSNPRKSPGSSAARRSSTHGLGFIHTTSPYIACCYTATRSLDPGWSG